jgi:hypothetical protein
MAKREFHKNLSTMIGTCICLAALASPAAAVTVNAAYLYTLSDFTGDIPFSGGTIFVDKQRSETYVLSNNLVTVFNVSGLQVYRFGDNRNLGRIVDLTVDRDGAILILSYNETGDRYELIRCNFRGEPKAKVAITGLTPNFNVFYPNHIAYQDGQIYLADGNRLMVAIIDVQGNVKRLFDIAKIIELDEKDRDNSMMDGFGVDKDGSILFTLPMLFTAYRVSLDGKASSFGKPGSIPGNFGVISGIIADNRGNYLVSDKLKCVVNVFDKNFKFLLEFGGRGRGPGNLIIPQQLAIDGSDRVYVIQEGNRGVSVFSMQYAD